MGSTLVSKNVKVNGHRTSVRLESSMWDALAEICRREGLGRNELVSAVQHYRPQSSLTAAIRVFIANYYRAAATESGHWQAGHGGGASEVIAATLDGRSALTPVTRQAS